MRSLYFTLAVVLMLSACAASPAQRLDEQTAHARAQGRPVLVYQIQTNFLSIPGGAYTRMRFANTGNRPIDVIAFEVVPYYQGAPIMWNVSHPIVFGAKGDFEPGKRYAVVSTKPVWSGPWGRVDCVHLIGLVVQYSDGQVEKIGRKQITDYLSPEIVPQNCTQPSHFQVQSP